MLMKQGPRSQNIYTQIFALFHVSYFLWAGFFDTLSSSDKGGVLLASQDCCEKQMT